MKYEAVMWRIITCLNLYTVLMDLTELCRCCQGRVKVRCVCFGFWEELCVCVCFLGSWRIIKYVFTASYWHLFFFSSFSFSFATTVRFPKVTNWVQRRQLCKCLNLVAFHRPVQWGRLFFNSVCLHVCALSSVNYISIKTRTNPSFITPSYFSTARGNCSSDVQKKCIFLQLHWFCFQGLAQL